MDTNVRTQVENGTQRMYLGSPCAICNEGNGADVFWFGSEERTAHANCAKSIENCEKDVMKEVKEKIKVIQKDEQIATVEANLTHQQIVIAVEKGCDGLTLKKLLEKEGEEKLKHLFDTIGRWAAFKYICSINS